MYNDHINYYNDITEYNKVNFKLSNENSTKNRVDFIKNSDVVYFTEKGKTREIKQLEYLEANGTQYIDLDFIPLGTTKVEIKAQATNATYNSISDNYRMFMPFFGAINYNNAHNKFWVAYATDNNTTSTTYRLYFYNCSGSAIYANFSPYLNATTILDWHVYSFNKTMAARDGVQLTASATNQANSTTIGCSMYLFSVNAGTNTKSKTGTSKLRIAYFKLKDANDNLIRDMIPVKINNIGYMFDKVTGRFFGNAGTGDFILGPEKSTFENMIFINYLKSTGTQWIDIEYGLKNTKNFSFEIDYLSEQALTVQSTVCGSATESTSWTGILWTSNNFYIGSSAHNNGENYAKTYNVRTKFKCVVNGDLVTTTNIINGQEYTWSFTETGTISSNTWLLFAYWYANKVNGMATAKIYSFKLIDGYKVIRDMVPVRIGSVGYMFDKIERRLYSNAGTGNFTLGEDKYDKELEYLESNGTQFINLNFGFDKTDEVYTDFALLTTGRDKYIVSPSTWNNSNNRFALGYYNNNYCVGYGSVPTQNTQLTPSMENDFAIHHWEYKNYMFSITDLGASKDVSSISFGSTSANLKLFYGYNDNTSCRISRYKHIKNGVIVVDLIPVSKNGIGYMYDKISEQLLSNSGTGNFILGPEI